MYELGLLFDSHCIEDTISLSLYVQGKSKPSDVLCHSRDIWAFGQLMLILMEDTALEG